MYIHGCCCTLSMPGIFKYFNEFFEIPRFQPQSRNIGVQTNGMTQEAHGQSAFIMNCIIFIKNVSIPVAFRIQLQINDLNCCYMNLVNRAMFIHYIVIYYIIGAQKSRNTHIRMTFCMTSYKRHTKRHTVRGYTLTV